MRVMWAKRRRIDICRISAKSLCESSKKMRKLPRWRLLPISSQPPGTIRTMTSLSLLPTRKKKEDLDHSGGLGTSKSLDYSSSYHRGGRKRGLFEQNTAQWPKQNTAQWPKQKPQKSSNRLNSRRRRSFSSHLLCGLEQNLQIKVLITAR